MPRPRKRGGSTVTQCSKRTDTGPGTKSLDTSVSRNRPFAHECETLTRSKAPTRNRERAVYSLLSAQSEPCHFENRCLRGTHSMERPGNRARPAGKVYCTIGGNRPHQTRWGMGAETCLKGLDD